MTDNIPDNVNAKYVNPKIIQGSSSEGTVIVKQPSIRRVTVTDRREGSFTIRYTPRNVDGVVLGDSTDL